MKYADMSADQLKEIEMIAKTNQVVNLLVELSLHTGMTTQQIAETTAFMAERRKAQLN